MKGKLHCAYLNLDILARNALRMAQYNQHVRQERNNPNGEENQPIVDQSVPLPIPTNDIKLVPHYQNGYGPYPVISTPQVINPYSYVVQQPVIQVPQIPHPPQVGQVPIPQGPGVPQVPQVPIIYSMEVQQPSNTVQLQRATPNGNYPLAPGLAIQMAQPYFPSQAPNTLYPPPPPPPPQQHIYSQHPRTTHHMNQHLLSPPNHTVDKIHSHPQQQQSATSSSSSSSLQIENQPHHKPLEGRDLKSQSTNSNSSYQHQLSTLLQANKQHPGVQQSSAYTSVYTDIPKHHQTPGIVSSLHTELNTLSQVPMVPGISPIVNNPNIVENKSVIPLITSDSKLTANAGNNNTKQISTLPPLKRDETGANKDKELRLPSINNLRSENETDKKPEILKLLS